MPSFQDLKLTRQFLNALEEAGFQEPTPIQVQAIPPIRAGQDVIGIAQTGTGKTAAYLLPLLQMLNYAQGNIPRAVVFVPTKELVLQVDRHARALSAYTDLRRVALYGGIGPKTQIAQLREGCDLIVATPGRFMELYLRGEIGVKLCKHIVLDEADRMMDMGFMPQIRQLQEVLPTKRQNLLFSATFPQKVERLGDEFLLWPPRIEVTPHATPVETVEQHLFETPNRQTTLNLLQPIMETDPSTERVIVFARSKEDAEAVAKRLDRMTEGGVRTIHSNKGQNSRINALADFRAGDARFLVSTDVSARGIDIPDVTHVVNFSVPTMHEDYVHRIGRTGRIFKTGVAFTFMNPAEKWHIKHIEKLMNASIPRVAIPDQVEVPKTLKAEHIAQAREIDKQMRRDNPDFKGAFHEKKRRTPPPGKGGYPPARKGRGRGKSKRR